jgi:hypothetical protein
MLYADPGRRTKRDNAGDPTGLLRQALRLIDEYFAGGGNYCNTAASTKKGFGNISQPLKIIGSPSRTRTYNLVVNFIVVNPRLGCGPGARSFWAKSIGLPISDFELWISDLLGPLFFNAHSAIYNPQFQWPARSMKWKPPHGCCPEGPCPRAWHQIEGHL